MSVPEHLWRFPTKDARVALASRLSLPYTAQMQDWEWEVSDPNRIAEFLALYKSGELTEDERFSLIEIIIQSFDDQERDLTDDILWQDTLNIITQNLNTHIHTVWYWSDFEGKGYSCFVSRHLKEIRDSSGEKYA